MTNTESPAPQPLTRAERDALYGVARTDAIVMPTTIKRLPPRHHRHSVAHRAYR